LLLEISDRAYKELKSIMTEPGAFLRVQVTAGGCAGLTFRPEVDTEMADNDMVVYEQDGLKIVSDVESALYLNGLRIDYSDDLVDAGFGFTNPYFGKSCGCGQSFEA